MLKVELEEYALELLDDAEHLTDDVARAEAHKKLMDVAGKLLEMEKEENSNQLDWAKLEGAAPTKGEKILDAIKSIGVPVATIALTGVVTALVNNNTVDHLAATESEVILTGKKAGVVNTLWKK